MKRLLVTMLLLVAVCMMAVGCGDNETLTSSENGEKTGQQTTQSSNDDKDNYVNYDDINGTTSATESTKEDDTKDTSASSTTGDNWSKLY